MGQVKQTNVLGREFTNARRIYRRDPKNNSYKDLDWMQFTGLKDKNGKEIYEGDVMRFQDGGSCKPEPPRFGLAVVEITEGAMFLKTYPNDDWHFLHRVGEAGEIIGNIYENPELLQGSSQEK